MCIFNFSRQVGSSQLSGVSKDQKWAGLLAELPNQMRKSLWPNPTITIKPGGVLMSKRSKLAGSTATIVALTAACLSMLVTAAFATAPQPVSWSCTALQGLCLLEAAAAVDGVEAAFSIGQVVVTKSGKWACSEAIARQVSGTNRKMPSSTTRTSSPVSVPSGASRMKGARPEGNTSRAVASGRTTPKNSSSRSALVTGV